MHILLDNLGDGFITFPEFRRQLIELEREQDRHTRASAGDVRADAVALGFGYSGVPAASANYRVTATPEPIAAITSPSQPALDAGGKLCEWFDSTAPWSHTVNTWAPSPPSIFVPPTIPDFSWSSDVQAMRTAAPTRCHHGVPTQFTCKACADERANDGR